MRCMLATFILIASILIGSLSFGQSPGELIYMAEDYPPANYLKDGEITGASVEILKLIWEKMGHPEQPIIIIPWARGYRQVQTEPNHVLFSMSRTKEREQLFKWVGPIFTARQVLVGLADKNYQLDKLDDAKPFRIGTIKQDIGECVLFRNGFDNLESVSGLDHNIKKLLAGRVDLICQSESAINSYIEMEDLDPRQLQTVLVVNELGTYYAFNKQVPDSLVMQFQTALEVLEERRLDILQQYGIKP